MSTSVLKPPAGPRPSNGPPAVALVEEAVHLLRGTPAGTLALYLAGAVPWTVGFLYFWACATWFASTDGQLAWGALALAGLFVWLKCMQAEFGARLLARRTGRTRPPLTPGRLVRAALGQLRWQTWGVLLLPLAVVLTLPLAWVYAFFQNLSVLDADDASGPGPGGAARQQAALWPAQNHLALLLISAFGLAVWINWAAAFYLLPVLAHRLLGLDNVFGLQGIALFNTNFLASVSVLTWLTLDPLVKAFYALRVFYGLGRRTGADLQGELAAIRSGPGGRILLVVLAGGLGLLLAAPRAAAAAAPAPAVEPAGLDRAIDGALQQGDFAWRLRPLPAPKAAAGEDGMVTQFLKAGVAWLKDGLISLWHQVVRLMEWIERLWPGRPRAAADGAGSSGETLRVLLYVLLTAALLLLAVVLFLMWRKGRGPGPVRAVPAATAAEPDLSDENVQAAQLPADGWLALARGQLAAGEWRLALRALYLATLARLAAEGLLTLARAKTNLDYETELARRALARQHLVAQFRGRRLEFEEVWYGRVPAGEQRVRAWLEEMSGGAAP